MSVRHAQCPSCGGILTVPTGCMDCFVRCGVCHHRFHLPKIRIDDESIAEWLKQDITREEEAAEASAPKIDPPSQLAQEASSGSTVVLPALSDKIELIHLDKKGSLFEFDAELLKLGEFRCAIPKKCQRCGTKNHLTAHLIIYASRLLDSHSLESRHPTGSMGSRDKQLQHFDGEQLLDKFAPVPNIPPPGNLPMPYWICDMCTGAGAISGKLHVDASSGKKTCQLLIRSLARAEEFLIAAGGKGSPEHEELRQRIAETDANPWEALSESVQHRLGAWYRPGKGEHFVVYVPDRSLSRTEDGMSGLVVSNYRMIYHSQMGVREVKVNEHLRVQLSSAGGRNILKIKSPSWEVKHLSVDRADVTRLREALIKQKFKATWY